MSTCSNRICAAVKGGKINEVVDNANTIRRQQLRSIILGDRNHARSMKRNAPTQPAPPQPKISARQRFTNVVTQAVVDSVVAETREGVFEGSAGEDTLEAAVPLAQDDT